MIEHLLKKKVPLKQRKNPAVSFGLYLTALADRPFMRRAAEKAKLYRALYNEENVSAVKRDMIRTYIREGYYPDEYVDFAFFSRTPAVREDYVSHPELLDRFYRSGKNTFPRDKYERYRLVSKYFHREVLRFRFDGSDREKEEYRRFTASNDAFIIKPLKGTKGRGIEILSSADYPEIDLLAKRAEGEVLAEELIRQGKELALFHPQSINTLRFVSAMTADEQYTPLYALLRCGQGGAVVDNVGAGGIVSLVDLESGTIISDGLFNHRYFEIHPDTQIRFRGAQIPEWPALLALAEEIHRSIPKQMLIGWDFAWSEAGWELVEINPAPSFSSWQALAGKGIRPLLRQHHLL